MKHLVVIVGPTAIGKTAAAIAVAQHFRTEIISCDSRQFYRQLNIGVARPTPTELAAVPHHFIANRSVDDPYNVYAYEHEALECLQRLFRAHDVVVAVGGSGLYVDALCSGINLMPDPAPELRATLSARIARGELPQMLDELRHLDPDYYAVVDHSNPIRIQRALEVIITAGEPYSRIIAQPLQPRPFKISKIGLRCDREVLRHRIDTRVDQMLQHGLVDEVRNLLPYRHINTLNTVGYKEIFSYLDGLCTLEQAVSDIKNHTWQYAKKQMTWLKRYPEIIWRDNKNFSEILQLISGSEY